MTTWTTATGAVAPAVRPGPRPGRVGAEVELIAVTDTPSPGRPTPARSPPASTPDFATAARPTFEPGGQLELSPAPGPVSTPLVETVHRLLGRAGAIAPRRAGSRLESAGINPHHSCADVPAADAERRATAPCRRASTSTDPTVAG